MHSHSLVHSGQFVQREVAFAPAGDYQSTHETLCWVTCLNRTTQRFIGFRTSIYKVRHVFDSLVAISGLEDDDGLHMVIDPSGGVFIV